MWHTCISLENIVTKHHYAPDYTTAAADYNRFVSKPCVWLWNCDTIINCVSFSTPLKKRICCRMNLFSALFQLDSHSISTLCWYDKRYTNKVYLLVYRLTSSRNQVILPSFSIKHLRVTFSAIICWCCPFIFWFWSRLMNAVVNWLLLRFHRFRRSHPLFSHWKQRGRSFRWFSSHSGHEQSMLSSWSNKNALMLVTIIILI